MIPVPDGAAPEPRPSRLASAAFWLIPPLLCLALYWRGFTAWFRADDFAWLGTGLYIQNFHDFLIAIFAPMAQGTIRPLSERAFFMAGFSLFGLDALPFKIVIFATQFANLALVASIGARLSGLRWAGFFAAVFWVLNGAGIEPLGWSCVYNQVLCGFFLLLAFHFLLRYEETGERRYYWFQWAAFLLGFGALELNVVYPAIAAAYLLLRGKRQTRGPVATCCRCSPSPSCTRWCTTPWRRCRLRAATRMHFTGAMFRTLGRYWTWSVGPTFLYTPFVLPKWVLPVGIAVVSAGLLGFLAWKLRAGARIALFGLAWYLALLAPVLPLRDHQTEYYVFLPVIGLCWLGGWAAVSGWRAGIRGRAAAVTLAAIYALMMVPGLLATSAWNHDITMRVRNLVEGVAGVHERYPGEIDSARRRGYRPCFGTACWTGPSASSAWITSISRRAARSASTRIPTSAISAITSFRPPSSPRRSSARNWWSTTCAVRACATLRKSTRRCRTIAARCRCAWMPPAR